MYDDEFELTFDLSDEDKASRAPALEQEPVQEAAPEPAAETEPPVESVPEPAVPAANGRCVLISGGDRGIGAAAARAFWQAGYRVAVLAQPDWHDAEAFRAMGKPRYGVMIGGGNLDSMVAHYTVAKRRRTQDLYSPGGKLGFRPDRPTIVYANRAKEAFPDTPIIIGGLEASLRRFAHYDYWDDKVRRSILFDAPAYLLVYVMGESVIL